MSDLIAHDGHKASDMAMAMQAIRRGWEIKPVIREAVVVRCAQVLQSEKATKRERARAAQTLLAIDRLVMDSLAEEHRISRLDAGLSTENIAHAAVTPAGLAALAETLRLPQKPAEVQDEAADGDAAGQPS